MPSRPVTLDGPGLARLDQALLGLLDPGELPPGDVYVDEEGTPVARMEDGRVVAVRPRPWAAPHDVRSDAPVVVPVVGEVPAEPLPREAVLLLPAGAVRPDDARWVAWAGAWSRAAATVVEIPLAPTDAAARGPQAAAHYSTGKVLEVDTVTQPSGRGRVVFFTGLSGSGKSTLARGLVERIARTHTVTLLDGDVVRTHLSKGLGFSREDRDTNIRRIGWVAAEVAKHGGVAVCAPIAPYDDTRRWVRATVEAAAGPGSFALVWVATPLEVCESRDVKGLYARARAGEITGFTGIDDPYEEPTDAAVVVDTSVLSVDEALDRVEAALFPSGAGLTSPR